MQPAQLRVAAIQMVSSTDVGANLAEAGRLCAAAAEEGAQLIVLPENFAYMGRSDAERRPVAEPDEPNDPHAPIQRFLATTAREHSIWLVGGTLPLEVHRDEPRVFSACLVYDPGGRRVARYDKIHLFDVDVADETGRYRESHGTLAGSETVRVPADFGGLGLAVCYDVRFPEQFRALAGLETAVLALPAAFTVATGRAHWDTLVRARAIENQCALVAACQGGDHESGRRTWGRSMVVDAWGRVLANRDLGSGVVSATLDLDAQTALRNEFPVLAHRRLG